MDLAKNMKKHLHKLPFGFKLWWAKQLTYMFRGLGPTFNDDIVLYNELTKWIETEGKPTTSSEGYKIRKRIEELQRLVDNFGPTRDYRDVVDIEDLKQQIRELQQTLKTHDSN